MTAGDDLIAFLRARYAELRVLARGCLGEVGSTLRGEPYADGSGLADRPDFPSYPWGIEAAELAYLEAMQPAQALRDIDAKLRILDEHKPSPWTSPPVRRPADLPGDETNVCITCGVIDGQDDTQWIDGFYPCMTLRLLALPYSDHPEYREEWCP
jgi:hypothetical protein